MGGISMSGQNICVDCNQVINENAAFCEKCGARQKTKARRSKKFKIILAAIILAMVSTLTVAGNLAVSTSIEKQKQASIAKAEHKKELERLKDARNYLRLVEAQAKRDKALASQRALLQNLSYSVFCGDYATWSSHALVRIENRNTRNLEVYVTVAWKHGDPAQTVAATKQSYALLLANSTSDVDVQMDSEVSYNSCEVVSLSLVDSASN
jgi:predicted nucleic acid-binding Zn ribbon protein